MSLSRRRFLHLLGPGAAALTAGCRASPTVRPERGVPVVAEGAAEAALPGIDVLERRGFDLLRGKRVGLLTHAAAVSRAGTPTWRVLHESRSVRLVALYAPEHGLEGAAPADSPVPHGTHPPTGLKLWSVYGKTRRPTVEMLREIDVLVIDLQDIGSRSYTFISAMRYAAEAAIAQRKEVVILDRPNPLGGLKVDGPPLDADLLSYVGAFRVPYVHGLTIGELAHLGLRVRGVFQVTDAERESANLQVVRMVGWSRRMRWPETGLRFVPTSPYVADFEACVGYAMVGLGCELSGFTHGVGRAHPFRTLQFRGVPPERLAGELTRLAVPGVAFRVISVVEPASGKVQRTVHVDVVDWEAWRPVELSIHLHRLACRLSGANPYAVAPAAKVELFLKHVGSRSYFHELAARGASADVHRFLADWGERNAAFDGFRRRFQFY